MNDLPWDEDEEAPLPDDLKDRWEHRDHLYRMRSAYLSKTEIAAVRAWRMGEAAELDEPGLIRSAAAWGPVW